MRIQAVHIYILYLFGFFSSMLIQSVGQSHFAADSVWGASPGWQNEIAIWNLGVSLMLLGLWPIRDQVGAKLLPGLGVLSLCFGCNHLYGLIENIEAHSHWAGMSSNAMGLGLILFYCITRRQSA